MVEPVKMTDVGARMTQDTVVSFYDNRCVLNTKMLNDFGEQLCIVSLEFPKDQALLLAKTIQDYYNGKP